MLSAETVYYHSLPPFAPLFEYGLPILTYHKLGRRPPGTRLKGLYLSQRLFAKQLAELRLAGFRSVSLGQLPGVLATPNHGMALTFDDGFCNVLEFGLGPLGENNCRAMLFLVADRLGRHNDWETAHGEAPTPLMDAAQVRAWLAAGHEIGSHTLTHPWLTRLPPAQAREEISASKKKLEDGFGVPVIHFCYPYGDWNEAVRDLVIAAGYQTACTTQPGVTTVEDSLFSLKRITARYPSRSLKALWARLQRLVPTKA